MGWMGRDGLHASLESVSFIFLEECGREKGRRGESTLTLHAPFILVLEQALNSAAEAETAKTARIAVSFIVLAWKLLKKPRSSDWGIGGAEKV